jgi:hypothetical protein
MSIVEVFAFLFLFIACYGTMVGIGFVIDKLLRRLFGKGIFPEGYFE